jgi:hypothetical protein
MTNEELIELSLKNYRQLIMSHYWQTGKLVSKEDVVTLNQIKELLGEKDD